eukprot:scaffold297938_cov17-Tisochrysis_lutea.AAC.1
MAGAPEVTEASNEVIEMRTGREVVDLRPDMESMFARLDINSRGSRGNVQKCIVGCLICVAYRPGMMPPHFNSANCPVNLSRSTAFAITIAFLTLVHALLSCPVKLTEENQELRRFVA